MNDPKFQEGLREFSKSLRTAGVTYSQRAMALDSVDALGYPLPEFLVTLSQAIGPTLGVILVAWLQGRSGRKVRVKIGDVEAEARTVEEVESLLQKDQTISGARTTARRRELERSPSRLNRGDFPNRPHSDS